MALHREVEITVPPGQTDELVTRIGELSGVLGLRVQKGASVKPTGDVIVAQVTNTGLHTLVRMLWQRGVGLAPSSSITTTHIASVISPDAGAGIGTERSESTWEEIELEIGKQSNMTGNGLAIMAISGALAVVGVATNALHVVIAAMVIAPAFEPITRIGLGLVGRSVRWRRGVAHTCTGYLALVAGAAATAVVLRSLDADPTGGQSTYLEAGSLISYWTTISPLSLLASSVAAVAGALLIATDRAVLTAGVMIALALVPSAAIMGIAAVVGDASLFGRGALRWGMDVALVLVGALIVFAWKSRTVQKRPMLN